MINQNQENPSNQKIGVIGLGLMGTPMCQQLHNSGIDLCIWNRNSQPSRDLSEKLNRTTVCKTPAEVALNCDIIITMVTDAPAVEAIVFGKNGIAESCRSSSLLIDMGTTSVTQTRNFSKILSEMGGSWVDAPVSGGTTAAENGSLTIMAGGRKESFDRALPFLKIMGERITYVGEVGAGQIAKSANQMIVGLTIGAVAEAFTLARHNGVEPEKIREALFGGFAHSRILELHGERMIKEDYAPRAKCSIQRKDISEAIELANSVNLSLPSLATNLKLWDYMVENGLEDLDHSALLLAIDPLTR